MAPTQELTLMTITTAAVPLIDDHHGKP